MEHINDLTNTVLGDTNVGSRIENKLRVPPPMNTSSTRDIAASTATTMTTTMTTTNTPTIATDNHPNEPHPSVPFVPTPSSSSSSSSSSFSAAVAEASPLSSPFPPSLSTNDTMTIDNAISINSSVIPGMIGNAIATSSSSSSSLPPEDPPSSPPSLYEDTDSEWIALYGPSLFQSAVLQGQWRIYKNIENGALYYVNTLDNNYHTWDCPYEVAVEMKRKAVESMLDEYSYEGLGADFESNGPWVPPSPTKAVAYRSAHVFGGGRASCCKFRDDDFAQLGVGVALYFRTLKAFIIIFALLTVLSLPSWAFYATGQRVTGSVPDPLKFTRVSLGNIGSLTYDSILSILNTREQLALVALASSSGGSNTSGTSSSSSSSSASLAATLNSSSSSSASGTYSDSELLDIPYFVLPEYGFEIDGLTVAYTITAFDLGAMLLFLIALAILRGITEKFIAYAERKNVSAADYTIFVKGLPSDVTVEEVRDHFSTLFALDGTGADTNGKWDPSKHAMEILQNPHPEHTTGTPTHRYLRKHSSWLLGKNKSNRIVPIPTPTASVIPSNTTTPLHYPNTNSSSNNNNTVGSMNAPPGSLMINGMPHPSVDLLRNSTLSLSTTLHTTGENPYPQFPTALSSSSSSSSSTFSPSGYHLPSSRLSSAEDEAFFHQQYAIPTDPKKLKAAALAARRTIDTRRRKGYITDADPENHFTSRIEVIGKGIVTDISHNNDATFAGSWIADISLVRPVNNLLSAYLSVQELAQKLREARARVKMWSPGTPFAQGPNPVKREAAIKQVDKLGSELAALRESLKKKDLSIASVESTCVGSAFVTFNCEESLQRCLRAYRGSTSSILRPFQSAHLRLRCPGAPGFHGLPGQEVVTDEKGKIDWKLWYKDQRSNYGHGYTLQVTKAPDPSDVIHENLAISSTNRCLRQTCTGFMTFLLVIIGLVMMIIAQSYSKLLATSTPDLSLCSTEIPALYFGGYANVTDAKLALTEGYGQPSNLQSSLAIQSRRRLLGIGKSWDTESLPLPSSSSSVVSPYSLPPTYRSLAAGTDNPNPSASTLMLTRISSATDRSVEDDLCPSDRVTIAYRYNFSDVPFALRNDYPALPYSSSSSSANNNLFTLGTTIPYTSSSRVATVCDLSQAQAIINSVDPSLSPRNILDPGCPDPRLLQANEGYCPCIAKASDRKCLTLPCFRPELEDDTHRCKEFTASTIVGCYCVDTLNAYIASLGTVQGFIAYTEREGDVCETFISSYIQAQSLIVISAAAASIINILLGLIIPALTAIEGHASLSSRSRALAVKVAAAQTINTGLTALLVNARLPKSTAYKLPSIVSTIGLLNGQFDDFTTPWYGVVGTTICTTALINTLIPPFLMSLEYFLDSCRRSSALRRPGTVVTQAAMDELYVGATFETPRRYPLMITMVSVSLMYSAGFPLLLPLACFGFLLQYIVDKIMILRFYRKPPAYDASMTRLLLGIMPYLVLVHCGFAFWMLSSPGTLPSAMLTPELIMKLLGSLGISTSLFTSDSASVQQAAATYGLSEEEMTNALAATFFAKYTALVGDYDAVGILPRLLRLNTFPYFLFLLIVFVLITLSNVLYTVYSLIMVFLRGITCGFICCSGRGGGCGSSQGFDMNSLRKQTSKMLATVLHSYLDNPHISTAIQYLTEFKAHARAYASFNRVKAGLLFEALFVRMIKETEKEEEELFADQIMQRKEELRFQRLTAKTERENQIRAEIMAQTLAEQQQQQQQLSASLSSDQTSPTVEGTKENFIPPPIILFPNPGPSLSPTGTAATSSSVSGSLDEETDNDTIIKELTEKHKHLTIHKGPPLLLDGETTGLGKGLAPFTQEFSRIHDTYAAGATLTYAEIDAGWRLQEVDARTLDDRHGLEAAYNRTILMTALDRNVAPKGTKEFLEKLANSTTFLSSSASTLTSPSTFIAASIRTITDTLSSTIGSPILDTFRTKSHRYRSNRKLLLPPVILQEVEKLEEKGKKGRRRRSSSSSTNGQPNVNGGTNVSPSKEGMEGTEPDYPSSSSRDLTDLPSIPENGTITSGHHSTPVKNNDHAIGNGALPIPDYTDHPHPFDSKGLSTTLSPSNSVISSAAATHITEWKHPHPSVTNDILVSHHNSTSLRSKVSKLFLESIFYLRKLHTVDETTNNLRTTVPFLSPNGPSLSSSTVGNGGGGGGFDTIDNISPSSVTSVASSRNEPGYAKRTWEVIRDAGLYSYDVQKNPRYTNAFAIAKAGEMEDQEDERIQQEQLRLMNQSAEMDKDPNREEYEVGTSKWAGDANLHHHRRHIIDEDGEIGVAADI